MLYTYVLIPFSFVNTTGINFGGCKLNLIEIPSANIYSNIEGVIPESF